MRNVKIFMENAISYLINLYHYDTINSDFQEGVIGIVWYVVLST